jgi:hypothetical protein
MYSQHPASWQPDPWPPPPRTRNRKDVTATVLLSIAQLVMSGAAAALAAVMMLRAGLSCTEAPDCETERVHHFDHQADIVVTLVGGGDTVALLLAGAGIAVAAWRRSLMWIWPALGLGVVVVSYGVSAVAGWDSLSSMQ